MSDVAKALSDFFKLPFYVLGSVFLFAVVGNLWLLREDIQDWPGDWVPLSVVRASLWALAVLAALLILLKAVGVLGTQVWPHVSREIWIERVRNKVSALPESAKAALRALADTGQKSFYGEPSQEYVTALRDVGLVRVNHADRQSKWGLYYLTEDGLAVTDFEYKRFADLLLVPAPKVASIQASMKAASAKAPNY